MMTITWCDANASVPSEAIDICKLDFVYMITSAVLIIVLFVKFIHLMTSCDER